MTEQLREEGKNSIPVVIPAYEPDDRLPALCEGLRAAGITDVLLVDDGSGEAYRPIFDRIERESGHRVLRHAVNMGKGRALKDAFNAILNERPDALGCITADSDGQHTPEDIRRMMEALRGEPDRLILGCRDFERPGIPVKSVLGNKLTRWVMRFLCGVSVGDTQTGLRGIPRGLMRSCLTLEGERFEFETNMLILSRDVAEIRELPIETVYDSATEHQTHFHPVRDSLRIYRLFARSFARFLLSSVSSAVLDLLLFQLFCAALRQVPVMELSYILAATAMARVLSAAYNYFVNYRLVFHSRQRHGRSAARYAALAILQMLASGLLVTLGVGLTGASSELLVKVPVDVVLFFISYRIQREWVFGREKQGG